MGQFSQVNNHTKKGYSCKLPHVKGNFQRA